MQKILDSGAVLDLTLCSFAEGNRLMKAVAKELRNTNISIGAKGDLINLKGEEAINTIKNFVTGLISSDEIEAALWPCMERGTYMRDGVLRKINKDLFEEEKARTDYLPVLKEALTYNLSPFFLNLGSLLKDMPAAGTGTLK